MWDCPLLCKRDHKYHYNQCVFCRWCPFYHETTGYLGTETTHCIRLKIPCLKLENLDDFGKWCTAHQAIFWGCGKTILGWIWVKCISPQKVILVKILASRYIQVSIFSQDLYYISPAYGFTILRPCSGIRIWGFIRENSSYSPSNRDYKYKPMMLPDPRMPRGWPFIHWGPPKLPCENETSFFCSYFLIFEISRVPYFRNILLFSPWHFHFVSRGMLLNSLLDVNGSLDVDVDRECWSAKGGNHRMVGSWGCFHKFLELHVSMFHPVRIFNDSGGWWFIIRKSLTSYSFYIMSFCDR